MWGTPQNFLLAFTCELWKTPKNRILKKWKKIAGDITILHMCTKNHDQWGTVPEIWSGTIFFVILGHLLPFYPLSPNNPENHNFEKMKKAFGDVIILNLCNKKTRSYDVCLLRYEGLPDIIFCHFRPFFAFLPNYWPQQLKFGKKLKKHLDILPFYTCVPLIKIIRCMVPEIWSSTDKIFWSSWAIFCPFTP